MVRFILSAGVILVTCMTPSQGAIVLFPGGISGDENAVLRDQPAENGWFVGTILTVMRDESHIPVGGLKVILQERTDGAPGRRHTAVTNDTGTYHFRELAPSAYHRFVEYNREVVYSDSLFIDISASVKRDTLLIPVDLLE